jgi:hypothetical protein
MRVSFSCVKTSITPPCLMFFDMVKKGKVLPRTGHEGPEGEQRYSSILSLTLAVDEGGWSTMPQPLYPRERDPVPIL